MNSRGEFLVGGRNNTDADGNYTGGMTLAEMRAFKENAIAPATGKVAVQPSLDSDGNPTILSLSELVI